MQIKMQFPEKKVQKKTSMSEPPAVRPENGTKKYDSETLICLCGSPPYEGADMR